MDLKDYLLYIILGAVVLVLILAAVGASLLRRWKLRRLGIEGEKKVAAVLRKYAGIRNFKVINDLYLPLYDKTTQIDHILIGFFGMLVIETKNYSGEVYGDPKKKDWLHIVGRERNNFYNPLMQNQGHIDCIRHALGQQNIYSINIESLVVFTKKKTQIYVPSGLPVVKLNRLRKFLKQPRFDKVNDIDVEKLYNTLMDARVTDKKLIAQHNRNVRRIAKHKK